MSVIWKDIPGFEGVYKVSNDGRVVGYKTEYRCGNNGQTKRVLQEREIIGETRNKYRRVTLQKDKVKRRVFVHRLVAEAFIPNPNHKPEIDHINTNPSDNRVENLRWATRKENQNNPITNIKQRLAKIGEKNYWYKKTGSEHHASKRVVCVETGIVYDGISEATRQTGVLHIGCCCRGAYGRRTAGGFHWKFV